MPESVDLSKNIAVIIPARNEAHLIEHTVRACRAIPGADLVIVVDDGSTDGTQHVARQAGAIVVRHATNRGKHAALETGVKVAQMRDPERGRGRMVMFMDADVGESALETILLVEAVRGGVDMAVATSPGEPKSGGRGMLSGLVRRSVQKKCGWRLTQPLNGQRCFSPEAAQLLQTLFYGWGVEVGITFTIARAGLTAKEVPCHIVHENESFPGWKHRFGQMWDISWAMWRSGFRGGAIVPGSRAAVVNEIAAGRRG